MALITLRQLLDHAAENNYGVAAFNVNNMEQIQSIMEAADETDSPVIIQASAVPIAALPAVPAAVTQFRDEPADVLSLGEQFRPEQAVERLAL